MTEEVQEVQEEMLGEAHKAVKLTGSAKKPKQFFNNSVNTFFVGVSSAAPGAELALTAMDLRNKKTMKKVEHAVANGILTEK